MPRVLWAGVALAVVGLLLLNGVPGGSAARQRARARERRLPGVPDHRDGAVRAALRPARADVPADGDVVRRVHRDRPRARRARGAAWRDRLGRAPRDRGLRGRARLPDRDLGAGAHDRSPRRARVHARGAVRGARGSAARRRDPRLGGLARVRDHDGRDPRRGARGGGDAAPSRRGAGGRERDARSSWRACRPSSSGL